MNARFAGALRHPGIVSLVWALVGEIDTLAIAKMCSEATYHVVRHEWGANVNPHIHRNLISVSFCKFLEGLQKRLKDETSLMMINVFESGKRKTDDSFVHTA